MGARLLADCGPLAEIGIDPLMGYYGTPDPFPMAAIDALIRALKLHCPISARQGITGTEGWPQGEGSRPPPSSPRPVAGPAHSRRPAGTGPLTGPRACPSFLVPHHSHGGRRS